MAQQDYRHQQNRGRDGGRSRFGRGEDQQRGGQRGGERWQTGSDRDRYQTGDEQRYQADWDDPSSERIYEGGRSYSAEGYPEEFGYRRESGGRGREYGRDFGREREGRSGRGEYQGSREREGEQERWYGERSRGAGEFERYRGADDERMRRWREGSADEESGGDYYFGTGSHYGGGYGTAPSTRASEQGTYGALGTGSHSEWNERSDWLPEGGSRGTTGNEEYMRSAYGSQSGYGRDYGQQGGRGGYRSYGSQRGQGYGERQSSGRGGQGAGWGSGGQSYGGSSRYGQGSYEQGQYGQGSSSYGQESSTRQSFRGRGPKGYTRSDERLREMICERLTDDPDIDASDLSIEVASQVVTLSGTVEDRRTKYEIEEIVERCGGVKDINNQLRVQSERSQSGGQFGSYAGSTQSGTSGSQSTTRSAQGSERSAGSERGAASGSTGTTSSGTSTPTSTSGTSSTKRN